MIAYSNPCITVIGFNDFVMKYDPKEVAKRKRQEEERRRLRRLEKMKKEEASYHKANHGTTVVSSSADLDRNAKRSRVERIVSP